jgi:hypothetical protein
VNEALEQAAGWSLDTLLEGDLVALSVVGSIALILIVIGVVTWLKGQTLVSFTIWLIFIVAAAWVLLPPARIESIIDADPIVVARSVAGAVLVALIIGFAFAFRLAKPSSWWAQRRYASDKYDQAVERHGWSRPRAR